MAAGDRVLALAYPDRCSLVIFTMSALELMIERYAGEEELR